MVHKLIHRVTMFKLEGEQAQKGLLAAYDQLAKDQKKVRTLPDASMPHISQHQSYSAAISHLTTSLCGPERTCWRMKKCVRIRMLER